MDFEKANRCFPNTIFLNARFEVTGVYDRMSAQEVAIKMSVSYTKAIAASTDDFFALDSAQ